MLRRERWIEAARSVVIPRDAKVRAVTARVGINAPVEAVWWVLADFAEYPRWNPFILKVEGRARIGERLRVQIKPPGWATVTFRPTVLAVEPRRELRWRGHLLMRGLLHGEHVFRLEAKGPDCALEQTEYFSGLLAPIIGKSLLEPTLQGLEAMNSALKARVESLAR